MALNKQTYTDDGKKTDSGKKTNTNVVRDTTNTTNLAGVNYQKISTGTPKTSNTGANPTGINTQSYNLAGSNNVRNAGGSVRNTTKTNNNVYVSNYSKPATTAPNASNNLKKYQSTLSGMADSSTKKANEVVNKISDAWNSFKQAGLNNQEYQNQLRQSRFEKSRQNVYAQNDAERAELNKQTTAEDYSKFYNPDGSNVDFNGKIKDLNGRKATLENIISTAQNDTQKASAQAELDDVLKQIDEMDLLSRKRDALEEDYTLNELKNSGNDDAYKTYREEISHKNDSTIQRAGNALSHLLVDTANEVPTMADQFAYRAKANAVNQNIELINEAYQNQELTTDEYVKAMADLDDRIKQAQEEYSDSTSQQIRRVVDSYGARTYYGASDVEKLVLQTGESMAQFALHFAIGQGIASIAYKDKAILDAGMQFAVEQFGEETASGLARDYLMQLGTNALGGDIATITMSGVGMTSRINQLLDEGYPIETAYTNGLFYGLTSYLTEKIGMDAFVEAWGTRASVDIVGKILQDRTVTGFLSEGGEEFIEELVDPFIDSVTLGKDYEVNGNELLMAFMLGGVSGALMSGGAVAINTAKAGIEVNRFLNQNRTNRTNVTTLNNVGKLLINDRRQYNMAKAEMEILDRNYSTMTDVQKQVYQEIKRIYESAKAEYEAKSQTLGVDLVGDQVVTPTVGENEHAMAGALVPDVNQEVEMIETLDQLQSEVDRNVDKVIDAENKINLRTQEMLAESGYDIDAEYFNSLDKQKQNDALVALDFAKAKGANIKVVSDEDIKNFLLQNDPGIQKFSYTHTPEETEAKIQSIVDGTNGIRFGDAILINGNKNPILSTLVHELTHGTESSDLYDPLKEAVKRITPDWNSVVEDKASIYDDVQNFTKADGTVDEKARFENAEHEVVANIVENNLGNEQFLDDLIRYDYSLFSRIYQNIQALGNTDETVRIKNAFEKAFLKYSEADAQTNPAYSLDKTWWRIVKSLAPGAINKETGNFKSIARQIADLRTDAVKHGFGVVPLGTGSLEFAGVNDLLLFDLHDLTHMNSERHPIPDSTIAHLLQRLSDKVALGLDYKDNNGTINKDIILEDDDGKRYLLAINKNKDNGLYFINEIINLFEPIDTGDRNLNNFVLQNITRNGYYYANEKSSDFLKRLGISSQDAVRKASALDLRIPNEKRGVKFSYDKKIDADYMKAVENGDMETAQSLVRDYAVLNGYSPEQFYHATASDGFNEFDKNKIKADETDADYNGFWVTTNPDTSPSFRNPKKTYSLYIKYGNIAPANVIKDVQKELRKDWYNPDQKLHDEARSFQDEVRLRLEDMGYNSIVFDDKVDINTKELEETGATEWTSARGTKYRLEYDEERSQEIGEKAYLLYRWSENQGAWMWTQEDYWGTPQEIADEINTYRHGEKVVVLFEPNQLKSSAPVEYDDNGNVIPLSERFNDNTNDLRYSYSRSTDEDAELNAEIEKWNEDSSSPYPYHENSRRYRYDKNIIETLLNRGEGVSFQGKDPNTFVTVTPNNLYGIRDDGSVSSKYRISVFKRNEDGSINEDWSGAVVDGLNTIDDVVKRLMRTFNWDLNDDYGNVRIISNNNNNENGVQYSYGYHYGAENLDYNKKSERLSSRSGRGTGAFGTGTYFFGKEGAERAKGYHFTDGKTEHKADFSNYNLYKPKSAEQGFRLHQLFKELDDNYSTQIKSKAEIKQRVSEIINELNEIEPNLNDDGSYEDLFLSPEQEEDIKNRLIELGDSEKFVEDMLDDNRNERGGSVLADYLADTLNERYIDEDTWSRSKRPRSLDYAEDYENMESHIPELAEILDEDEDYMYDVVNEAIRSAEADTYKRDFWNGNYDSVGTRVMKKLGYEGIDVRDIKELDNSSYGSVIYDLKPESVRYSYNPTDLKNDPKVQRYYATIAPYLDTRLNSTNREELISRAEKAYDGMAKEIADKLGIKPAPKRENIGGFENDANEKLRELSWTYDLGEIDSEKAKLFTSLMGDLAFENQEAVICMRYLEESEGEHEIGEQGEDGGTYGFEYGIKYKDLATVEKSLQKAGIYNYNIARDSNYLTVQDFGFDSKLPDKIITLLEEDNYESAEERPIYSYYLQREDRQSLYRQRLNSEEGVREGDESNLSGRIQEANERVTDVIDKKAGGQESPFLRRPEAQKTESLADDDLNMTEEELDKYQGIKTVSSQKYGKKNIDKETGILRPKAIIELDSTIGKTTHEEEIKDGEDYAGRFAHELDNGADVDDLLQKLMSNELQNGIVRAYYVSQVLADRDMQSEYMELAQWARDIGNLGGKLVESNKILYNLDSTFSRAVYLTQVEENLKDEYKQRLKGSKGASVEQTISDLFNKYANDIINSKTNREFRSAIGALTREVNRRMPKTIWDRITQFRMLAMLSGSKTIVSNAVSNIASVGLYRMNSVNQALLESALQDVTIKTVDDTKNFKINQEDRRATLKKDSKVSKRNREIAKEVWKTLDKGKETKYGIDPEKIPDIIKKNLKTENDKVRSKASKFVDAMFETAQSAQAFVLSDAPFARMAFVQKFDELARARNINLETIDKKSKTYNRLIDDAFAYAEEVVSHNETDISKTIANITRASASNVRINEDSTLVGLDKAIKRFKERANNGEPIYQFIDKTVSKLQKWFIPFYKTNASIFQKSLQYSPLEWVQVANDWSKVKAGKMEMVDMVDHMAKAVTGSELYLLGMAFGFLGWLKWEKDDEDYSGRLSVKVPGTDNGYTVDFIDPVSTIFAKGVVLAQEGSENGVSFKTLENLVHDYEDIFLSDELDMFSSMKDFFDTVGKVRKGEDDYGEYTLGDGASDIAFSVLNSYIPAIVRDVSRMIDPAKKVVYDSDNKKYLFNRLANSTPFRSLLVNKKDSTGRTMNYTQPFTGNDVFDRLLTQMVSRGKLVDSEGKSVTTRTGSPTMDENSSNAFSQMAKDFQYKDENGDGFSDSHWIRDSVPSNIYPGGNATELTPEEKDEYGTTWTNVWNAGANYLVDNDTYKGLDYENQADVIYELQGFARECIEADYCKAHDIEMTEAQRTANEIRNFCTVNGKVDGKMLGLIALGTAKENKLASGGQRYVMAEQDENGKTIRNSRQLAMRHIYEEAGIYDQIIKAVQDSDGALTYADFGLGKTVVESYSDDKADSDYQKIYNKVMKSSKSSKSKTKKVTGGSAGGITKAKGGGTLAKIKGPSAMASPVRDTKIANSFFKAYANTFNRKGSSEVSSASGGQVVCPRCGNRVSSKSGRCPICGASL